MPASALKPNKSSVLMPAGERTRSPPFPVGMGLEVTVHNLWLLVDFFLCKMEKAAFKVLLNVMVFPLFASGKIRTTGENPRSTGTRYL